MAISVHAFRCNQMKNLSYVIEDSFSNDAVIIDPTWNVELLFEFIDKKMLTARSIWLTHTHYDHIQGVPQCHARFSRIPTFVHHLESDQIDTPQTISIMDHDHLKIGGYQWQVLHTPGHSHGGVCFYFAPYLITGDTLFINGCGRADLKGSDVTDLFLSLQRLKSLPDTTIIYPGHDYGPHPSDSMQSQKLNNRFLSKMTCDNFVKLRLR